jgi:hypothetical protein
MFILFYSAFLLLLIAVAYLVVLNYRKSYKLKSLTLELNRAEKELNKAKRILRDAVEVTREFSVEDGKAKIVQSLVMSAIPAIKKKQAVTINQTQDSKTATIYFLTKSLKESSLCL